MKSSGAVLAGRCLLLQVSLKIRRGFRKLLSNGRCVSVHAAEPYDLNFSRSPFGKKSEFRQEEVCTTPAVKESKGFDGVKIVVLGAMHAQPWRPDCTKTFFYSPAVCRTPLCELHSDVFMHVTGVKMGSPK